MKTTTRLFTARLRANAFDLRFIWLAALAMSAACAVPVGDEDIGVTSEALCPKGVICDPPPAPPVCRPPDCRPRKPAPETFVTLTSDDLNGLVYLLAGANLSVDTTKTAPPVYGAPTTASVQNPAWAACRLNLAECDGLVAKSRASCIADVYAECDANYPRSIVVTQSQTFYSYLTFSDLAKEHGAVDVLFPLERLHHEGSVFSFYIDINYVHSSFLSHDVTAGFLPGPAARIGLSGILSNSPTVILNGDSTFSPTYPDINLTDMSASVTLGQVGPTPDGQSVDYGSVYSNFGFQWDVTDVPDWLAGELVDVQGQVERHVTSRINAAFNAPSSHAALSKALGAIIKGAIDEVHPAGFSAITKVDSGGNSWNVYYNGN